MSKLPAVFHLGLHKTGTSALQQQFFQPKYGFAQNGARSWLLPIFVDKGANERVSSDELQSVESFIDSAHNKGLYPVFSHERLSGHPLSGGYDRLSIWKRIQSLNGDVKILYVIREQKSWLYSAWKQLMISGSSISLKDFLSPDYEENCRIPVPRLEYLNYANDTKTLHEMFGADNVCVLPQELLFGGGKEFYERLKGFLNLGAMPTDVSLSKVNESKTLSEVYFRMFLNGTLFKTSTSPSGIVNPIKNKYNKAIYDIISNGLRTLPEIPFAKKLEIKHRNLIVSIVGVYYDESNAEAAKTIGIDLRSLGYSCSASKGV